MGIITYNGQTSQGLFHVEHPPVYEFPEKDVDVIHVPGKNGDIIIDKGTYKNINRPYDISMGSRTETYTEIINRISEWLHSASGYARLEDTYEPNYYRLAMYIEENGFDNIYNMGGRTTIRFNCKPQRFLKTGDTEVTFNSAGTLTNPTKFTAQPIITVNGNGNGVLNVGGYVINLTGITTKIVLDSVLDEAYDGATNLNGKVAASKGLPRLVPGQNGISFSGGITSVKIAPKWWTL